MGQEFSTEEEEEQGYKNYVAQLKTHPNFKNLDPEEIQRIKQNLSNNPISFTNLKILEST